MNNLTQAGADQELAARLAGTTIGQSQPTLQPVPAQPAQPEPALIQQTSIATPPPPTLAPRNTTPGAQGSPKLDHQQPHHSEPVSPQLIKYHQDHHLTNMQFHQTVGQNIKVSPDRTIAIRLLEKQWNGYVFTNRPLKCGEKLVVQILSVQKSDIGGLAFGMTACDPSTVSHRELPDDSDCLLDRGEYWVVCKDVYTKAEIGDELSFFLTTEGNVIKELHVHVPQIHL